MSHTVSRNPELDLEDPFNWRHDMWPGHTMTQDQFFDFCQKNRKIRFERSVEGEITIMAPTGAESGAQDLSVGAQLYYWARSDGTGKTFGSSTGCILPNGANRSPDVSWVSKERLASFTPAQMKKFLPLCPDVVIEILSPSDGLKRTLEKMDEHIENGDKLGWFINPRNQQAQEYRPGKEVQILEKSMTLFGRSGTAKVRTGSRIGVAAVKGGQWPVVSVYHWPLCREFVKKCLANLPRRGFIP